MIYNHIIIFIHATIEWAKLYTRTLTRAFPDKSSKAFSDENPTTVFTKQDLISPTECGKKVLSELNSICQESFKESFEEVITKTPRSNLVLKPSSQMKQRATRKVIRTTKRAIQNTLDQTSIETVMASRISWRRYDLIRKRQALESAPATTSPTTSRCHGSSKHLSEETKEALLQEAETWGADQPINWTQLARAYGLKKANDGQTIKEFLREHGVAAAMNRKHQSTRRKRKRLPEGIPFPMQRPSSYHKKKLGELEESGHIAEGTPVAPTTVSSYKYDKEHSTVVESKTEVYARKRTLHEIRLKLLRKHEEMGLLRGNDDSCGLTRDQLVERLEGIGESVAPTTSVEELRYHFQKISSTRHLKVWHDHSTVSGHGHFMVLISVMYDPALFLTPEEAKAKLGKEVDVQSIVEAPQLQADLHLHWKTRRHLTLAERPAYFSFHRV